MGMNGVGMLGAGQRAVLRLKESLLALQRSYVEAILDKASVDDVGSTISL